MLGHDRELGARHYNMHSKKKLCVNQAGLCRNMNSEDLFISEGRCNEIAIRCHSVTMSQCHNVTVSRFSHRMPVPIILYASMRTVANNHCLDIHWSSLHRESGQGLLDPPVNGYRTKFDLIENKISSFTHRPRPFTHMAFQLQSSQ